VWIYKGEVMPETRPQEQRPQAAPRPEGEKATFRDRRSERRGSRGRGGAPRPATDDIDDFDFPTSAEIEHDHESVDSTIDGAFARPGHPVSDGPHGGTATHDRAAIDPAAAAITNEPVPEPPSPASGSTEVPE
jgi:hypothetical protein